MFIKTWFMTMGADPAHILPSYTFTLFRIDGLGHPLFSNIPFPRTIGEEDFDEELFTFNRTAIIESRCSSLLCSCTDPAQASFPISSKTFRRYPLDAVRTTIYA